MVLLGLSLSRSMAGLGQQGGASVLFLSRSRAGLEQQGGGRANLPGLALQYCEPHLLSLPLQYHERAARIARIKFWFVVM